MIGFIPCGGQATRLHGLPKFLLPCPGGYLLQRLYDQMAWLQMARIAILASSGTLDLVRRHTPYGAESLCIDRASMADAIYAVQGLANEHITVVGMSDTYWTDETILARLVVRLHDNPQALIAVALWNVEPEQRHKLGMCQVENDEVTGLIDKPAQTSLEWAWGALAWRPEFWLYLNAYDAHMGQAIQRAIDAGEVVHAVYANGLYFDCGTADEYFAMIRAVTEGVQ